MTSAEALSADQTTTGRATPPRGRFSLPTALPPILFGVALLITYGFQIFSFNLTIDEEIYTDIGRFERAGWSIGLGRWAMALITLVSPIQVGPVVTSAIAIGLSGISWWVLARRFLQMTPLQSSVVASAAGTIPVLAFMFSFDTISVGTGIGNLLLVVVALALSSPLWRHRLLAVAAATFAVGIYDSFIVAVAILGLATVIRKPGVRTLALAIASSVLALALSRVISLLAFLAVPSSGYTDGFFDLKGFLTAPLTRTRSALSDVLDTIFLAPDRFAVASPWLGILMLLLVVGALAAAAVTAGTAWQRILRVAAVCGITVLPIVIEALSSVLPLRSMIYLPVLVLVLASVTLSQSAQLRSPRLRQSVLVAVTAVAILAVVGNATAANRLYSISETTYAMDRQLAFQIGQEKDRLLDGDQSASVPVVVNGLHPWPAGAFTEFHETIGLSFFDLNPQRATQFLREHGVVVTESTPSQQRRVQSTLATMPSYPQQGWVALDSGVLLVNFGGDE